MARKFLKKLEKSGGNFGKMEATTEVMSEKYRENFLKPDDFGEMMDIWGSAEKHFKKF